MSKEKIKVNLTRDEVSSYFKNTMKAATPDGCWHFVCGFSEQQLEDMEFEIKQKMDIREFKDSRSVEPYVDARIFNKMKILPSKVAKMDPTQLNLTPDVIIAFREQLFDLMGITAYKPKQQILPEIEEASTEE